MSAAFCSKFQVVPNVLWFISLHCQGDESISNTPQLTALFVSKRA
jgi:hypothetical protein